MVIITAQQQCEKEGTEYRCELLEYSAKNNTFVVELTTNNPYKPPIKIITDAEEINDITSNRLIKDAYKYASMTSKGEILVREYAVVMISGWMSKDHKWWEYIDEDDRFLMYQDPVWTFDEYAAMIQHHEIDGTIEQNGMYDHWKAFSIMTVTKYNRDQFDTITNDEMKKFIKKHIDDFMWNNYSYFEAVVNRHYDELKENK